MRAILNVLPHDITSNCVISGQEFGISRQLAMKVMPLKVRTAKNDKYRRHLRSKEPGLSIERTASISPKRASPSKT
jgi:hypothetical protein